MINKEQAIKNQEEMIQWLLEVIIQGINNYSKQNPDNKDKLEFQVHVQWMMTWGKKLEDALEKLAILKSNAGENNENK